MATADYYLCDVCGTKCFYDANLNYDFSKLDPVTRMPKLDYVGDMAAICDECAKTHMVVIVKRDELALQLGEESK
jgi:hypothetical protein